MAINLNYDPLCNICFSFLQYFCTGNLVSKKSEESLQLQKQIKAFSNSMVTEMHEISSRDQV